MSEQKSEVNLDDPKVQAAKKKWEAQHRPITKTSFEELFHYFKAFMAGENVGTFKDMAKRLGVSRIYLYSVYDRHFSSLLGKRPERHERTMKAAALRRERALFARPGIKLVVEQAQAAGYTVASTYTHGARLLGERPTSTLFVNGHRCHVSIMLKANLPNPKRKLRYLNVGVNRARLQQTSAVIVVSMVEGHPNNTFVIPSGLIEKKIFHDAPPSKYMAIYIPVERTGVYRNQRKLIDPWKYVGAWHLLRRRKE